MLEECNINIMQKAKQDKFTNCYMYYTQIKMTKLKVPVNWKSQYARIKRNYNADFWFWMDDKY